MVTPDSIPSEHWLNDKRVGMVSRPEVRFALPVLLDGFGVSSSDDPLVPTELNAKARIILSRTDRTHTDAVRQELDDKLTRLLGRRTTVFIEQEPDGIHAWITVLLSEKDVKQ